MSGYKAEITVARGFLAEGPWWPDDKQYPDQERVYLIRGLPMPGEKVTSRGGDVYVVGGLECDDDELTVVTDDGLRLYFPTLTPYDPEAEKVERVEKAMRAASDEQHGFIGINTLARIAVEAMRDES